MMGGAGHEPSATSWEGKLPLNLAGWIPGDDSDFPGFEPTKAHRQINIIPHPVYTVHMEID